MTAHAPALAVAVLVYDQVEELDFVGPYETFQVAGQQSTDLFGRPDPAFTVFTVAETTDLLRTRGGLLVRPHHSFTDHPPVDVVVLPGGDATGQSGRPAVLDWLRGVVASTTLTTSVCTGAFLLGALGLLDGQPATTHASALDDLAATYPAVDVRRGVRWVEAGRIITSAGISAGIDMSLYAVSRLFGEELALRTAAYLEYDWHRDPVRR
jgi:transcriptional regulator GlxA family with amidase domain